MTLSGYIKANNCLARSITIKSTHQAELINSYISKTYGSLKVNTEDYTTWRYYLNLNGEYHFSNNDVYVYVLETNTTEKLTKALLDTYKNTRLELSKFDSFYRRVIAQYPYDETLIKGIISPVDKSTVYNMEDGTIVSYSTYYVEDNELSIIRDLDIYLQNTYTRWFNPFYLNTDNRYLSIFLTEIYVTLPIKIELLRLDNIHTHKVHKFHMDNFFASNLDIDTTYMNDKSKFWLYQNLKTLMIHTGKNETLQEIVNNVLTPNTVGIGKLSIEKTKPTLLSTMSNPNTDYFNTKDMPSLIVESMNSEYDLDGVTLDEIVSMENNSEYIISDISTVVEDVSKLLVKNNEISLATKVVHLAFKGVSELMESSRLNILMDSLFYLHSTTIVTNNIIYTDSNTSVTYNITFNQGVRLLMYYLLKYVNEPIVTTVTIDSRNVVTNRDISNIKNLMCNDERNLNYIDYLISNKPNINAMYSSMDYITDYVSGVIKYQQLSWLVTSLVDNPVAESNIEVLNRHVCDSRFTVSINHIDTEIGLNNTINGYDYLDSIKELLTCLTENILIDTSSISDNTIRTYVDLVKKTTSYNLQVLNTESNFNSFDLFNHGLGVERAKPIIDAKVVIFNGLENLICDPTLYKVEDTLIDYDTYNNIIASSELSYDSGYCVGEHFLPSLINVLTVVDVDPLQFVRVSSPIISPEAELIYDTGYIAEEMKLVDTTLSSGRIESTIYIGNNMMLINDITLNL